MLNQTENQSFMPRVVKAPEVYEILRFSRDAFVCLSFVPGYFHKVGNNLWRDWSGVYMCGRDIYCLSYLYPFKPVDRLFCLEFSCLNHGMGKEIFF